MPPRCAGGLAERPACLLAVDEPDCESEDEETALLRPSERIPAAGGLFARSATRAPFGATRALLLCGAFIGTLVVLPAPVPRGGRAAAWAPDGAPSLAQRGPLEANAGEAILAVGAVPGMLGGLPVGAMNASCSVHPKCVEQSLHGLCCPNNVIGQMLSCCNASGSQGPVDDIRSVVDNITSTPASDDAGAAEAKAVGVEAPADGSADVAAVLAAANATTTGPANATAEESATSSTTSTEVGFDCSQEAAQWETAWSDAKKTWCCVHQQIHCEVTQTSTTVTADQGIICGNIYCQSDAVCCSSRNGAALCGSPGSTCCAGSSRLFGGDAPLVLCGNNSQCCNGVCLATPPAGVAPTPCLAGHAGNSTPR